MLKKGKKMHRWGSEPTTYSISAQRSTIALPHLLCLSLKNIELICENQLHECLIHRELYEVGSQAEVMSKNNSIVKVKW